MWQIASSKCFTQLTYLLQESDLETKTKKDEEFLVFFSLSNSLITLLIQESFDTLFRSLFEWFILDFNIVYA